MPPRSPRDRSISAGRLCRFIRTPGLYDRLAAELRGRRLGSAIEQAYVGWIKRRLQFHDHQHSAWLNQRHRAAFLQSLTEDDTDRHRRRKAFEAILFVNHQVLPDSFSWLTAYEPKNVEPKTSDAVRKGETGHCPDQTVPDSGRLAVRAETLE